ncbi:MAG TPA: AAA family ATPase [Verrucomicrobiales bacterium]|nr:AAA family ATPase [Verrucomicrobiales bacterium]
MPPAPVPARLPDPAEIVRRLDRFVIGQSQTKRELAVAVYNHYLAVAARRDFGKQHILLLGPSGSGKTFLVRCLADLLGVPVGFSSATSLVETGYVGDPVDSVVRRVLAHCDGDVRRAECGIVFLDEIDKIRRCNGGIRDVSGEGVQNGLLTLLDGRTVHPREHDHRNHDPIDTGRMLFICTGAFVELAEIVRRRLGTAQRTAGFRHDISSGADSSKSSDYEALSQVETRDLVQFGFIPELIGRFGTISALHELSEEDLVKILRQGEESALRQQSGLFALHGIKLTFEDPALVALAREAGKLGTGARALNRLVKRVLDTVSHRLAALADDGVTRINITREAVEGTADPTFVRGKRRLKRRDLALRSRALEVVSGKLRAPVSRRLSRSAVSRQGSSAHENISSRVNNLTIRESLWRDSDEAGPEWWKDVELVDEGHRSRFLRLARELKLNPASLHDFFVSCRDEDADAIRASLTYLDYLRRQEKQQVSADSALAQDEDFGNPEGHSPFAGDILDDSVDEDDDIPF